MAKTDDKRKRKTAPKQKAAPAPEAKAANAEGEPELQMRSPVGPLLWLMIPFISVIVYGLLTRE